MSQTTSARTPEPVRRVSIVVPFYNERRTLAEIVERVLAVTLPLIPGAGERIAREVILVDDGSTDGSGDIARALAERHAEVVAIVNPVNRGKGFALRTGFARATGEVIIVQDADMEYDPADYPALLEPILNGRTEIVYGSRILGKGRRGKLIYYLGGRSISALTSILYGAKITDEPTGYKVFRRSVLERIELKCVGFEFCPEFTAKALRAGYRIEEVPIRYSPRTAAEGKKITWRVGAQTAWRLFKHRLSR